MSTGKVTPSASIDEIPVRVNLCPNYKQYQQQQHEESQLFDRSIQEQLHVQPSCFLAHLEGISVNLFDLLALGSNLFALNTYVFRNEFIVVWG